MCSDPTGDERVIEALEACRPGSNDVSVPELQLDALLASDARLRELFQRLQRADSRLGAAMGEVPVPAGLQERILARLAAEQGDLAAEQGDLAAATPRRIPRRWWIAASGIASVAALLLAAFWIGFPGGHPRDEAGVLAAVLDQFHREVDFDPAGGRLVAEREPPAPFPMSRAVARVPELRWRVVRGLLGRQAVAYDFPGEESRRATLYVLPAGPSEIARSRPPTNPMQSTGGLCASVWKEGDRLYVLVVRGDARAYRRLIYAPSGPLT